MGLGAIQFVGREQVLKAFDSRDAVRWSFWQGKQMLFKYDGDSATESRTDLASWLDMMTDRTGAIYTLKVYEELSPTAKIKSTTPDDGSFNFKLYLGEEYSDGPRRVGYPATDERLLDAVTKLTAEVTTLKAKVGQPMAPEDEPLETWEKIMDHPLVLGAAAKFLGIDIPAESGARMGAVPGGTTVDQIIEGLRRHDADIEDDLYHLLQIADRDPSQFKMLVGMLRRM